MNIPKIFYLLPVVFGLIFGNAAKQDEQATEPASNAANAEKLTSVENPFEPQENGIQLASQRDPASQADAGQSASKPESVYDSFDVEPKYPTIEEIRAVVRDELGRAGLRSSTGGEGDRAATSSTKEPESKTTSTPVPVAPKVVYSQPVYSQSYGSTGGSTTTYQMAQPVYSQSYGSSYGSTGGSVSSAATAAPRTGILRRVFGRSSRYYTNSNGCTVDRRTGRVISCPTR